MCVRAHRGAKRGRQGVACTAVPRNVQMIQNSGENRSIAGVRKGYARIIRGTPAADVKQCERGETRGVVGGGRIVALPKGLKRTRESATATVTVGRGGRSFRWIRGGSRQSFGKRMHV